MFCYTVKCLGFIKDFRPVCGVKLVHISLLDTSITTKQCVFTCAHTQEPDFDHISTEHEKLGYSSFDSINISDLCELSQFLNISAINKEETWTLAVFWFLSDQSGQVSDTHAHNLDTHEYEHNQGNLLTGCIK